MQFEHLVQVNDRTLVDLPVLDRLKVNEIFQIGLADFLRDTVDRTNRLNTEIYRDFHFSPP